MTVAAAAHDSIVELQIANDYKACMAQHWFCTFSSLIQIVIGCHGCCVASEITLPIIICGENHSCSVVLCANKIPKSIMNALNCRTLATNMLL